MTLNEFLEQGSTVYHTTAAMAKMLFDAGFQRLFEDEAYTLLPGGKYFVTRSDASLIAFSVPVGGAHGFQIAAAHSDSPALFVTGEKHDGNLVRLTVEKYGGPHSATWFDRPLKLSGRVFVKAEAGVRSVLYERKEPLYIPSVAPHQDRESEKRVLANPAVDLLPIFKKDDGEANALKREIALALSVTLDEILSYDLFLSADEKPRTFGDGFICAPHLDDLACVYGLLTGFLKSKPCGAVSVLTVFNGEEVGSAISEGADSDFLHSTLLRISEALEVNHAQMLAKSFMVSADNAHAVHPAHPELYDVQSACHINGGIVIKHTASRRYTTDAFSDALTRELCRDAGVPVQDYRNRADLPGGGTLGAISAKHVSVPSVDIGLAQLSMHSACELGGTLDVAYLTTMSERYFSASLTYTTDGAAWQYGEMGETL